MAGLGQQELFKGHLRDVLEHTTKPNGNSTVNPPCWPSFLLQLFEGSRSFRRGRQECQLELWVELNERWVDREKAAIRTIQDVHLQVLPWDLLKTAAYFRNGYSSSFCGLSHLQIFAFATITTFFQKEHTQTKCPKKST